MSKNVNCGTILFVETRIVDQINAMNNLYRFVVYEYKYAATDKRADTDERWTWIFQHRQSH